MRAYWQDPDVQSVLQAAAHGAPAGRAVPNSVVTGRLPDGVPPGSLVRYWAAAPHDSMTTFAGSGLPFPNPQVAYEHSSNVGTVRASAGSFEIHLAFPNSFYTDMGTRLLPPHVLLQPQGTQRYFMVPIGRPIPHRVLTSEAGNYTRSLHKLRGWSRPDLAFHRPY